MKVQDKVALVTGGAQGLGGGFAEALLKNGATVVIADNNVDVGMQKASELINEYGNGRCTFMECDVTKQEDLNRLYSKTKELYGNVDISVNNAGIGKEHLRSLMIDINLKAVVECSYLAMDYMRKDKGGRGGLILNISSFAGLNEGGLAPVYTATKYGVIGITRALGPRDDVVDQGVRVSCLCPALTRTALLEYQDSDIKKQIEERGKERGIMEVQEVVDAFMKVVDNDMLHAGVVSVLPGIVEVVYPDTLKGTRL